MSDSVVTPDSRVESLLERWKMPFELDATYDLDKVKVEKMAQVRKEENRAPKASVAEYASQMSAGALFPPIVVSNSDYLIDGNTRLAAARQIGLTALPAYVVKVVNKEHMPILGAALNQMGGQRLTNEDALHAAQLMIDENYVDADIAKFVGRTVDAVRKWRKESRYRETAEAAGVDLEKALKQPKVVQQTLSDIGHVEPFKEAMTVAESVALTAAKARELVNVATGARSDTEAVEAIKAKVSEWEPQGEPPAKTRKSNADKALILAQQLLNLSNGDVERLLEVDASRQGPHRETWQQVHELAGRIIAAYGG